jgi:protein-S-isoprenylcysteine O-methyltransferase Ste14
VPYDVVLVALFATAALVAGLLLFVTAPYGRHGRDGWGPSLPARYGWVLMESPTVLAFGAFYALGPHAGSPVPLLLLALWMAHYLHRTFIYPFRLRTRARTPLTIIGMALCFNAANAYVNAAWLSRYGQYDAAWLGDPRLLAGILVFVVGYAINRWSDAVLRGLRNSGENGYGIPRGGLYRLISCPNYFGELLQWCGWALATWSLAGLSFAVFTAANLVPRALSHHRWYREQFNDYPRGRRAVIPFVL